MSYARARLYLGTSCVGMWVVLSGVALAFGLPARLLSASPVWGDEGQLVGVALVYACLSGAFDLFGGYLLPREYGRVTPPLVRFLGHWLRGAALHGVALVGIGLLLLSAARLGGFWLALAAYLLLSLGLVYAQLPLARLLGGLRTAPATGDLTVLESPYPHFTGGVGGLGGRTRVVVPGAWHRTFSGGTFEALVARRRALIGSRSRLAGLLLALGWNTLGFVLAYLAAGTLEHVAGLVTFSLWSTLWAFVGLLVLPTPSRRGVFAGDALAARVAEPSLLADAVRHLDRDQDDEPGRAAGVETFFHPIPSAARRIDRLEAERLGVETPLWGAWHPARTALYLSWANLSWLSRAVHCNIGRPEVWVFLPSD